MRFIKPGALMLCMIIPGLLIFACGQKKEGKVVVTEKKFILRQDTDHSFVVDAKGKIKNVGNVDLKKVVVTGYCRSCGEVLVNGKWFISDYEKTADQKDVISYLAAGDEQDFSFRGIAFIMDQSGRKPELPENLEIQIVSFEPVE